MEQSSKIMKISFVWDGVHRYGARWKDGLWAAMRILEKKHNIQYFEVDKESQQKVKDFYPDVILFWGAFSEQVTPEIVALPFKKAICFAGGVIDTINSQGWDLVFTESRINEEELGRLGIPYIRAFGTNEDIYKPMNLEKEYDAMIAGTFAAWKRHKLFAEAVGENGLAIGIHQKNDTFCFEECHKHNVKVLDEHSREEIAKFINQSHCVLNTADFWGGGQRLTLEAMACNIPPIVMADSPKNIEYVEESGFGKIVEPDVVQIQQAIQELKDEKPSNKGREYIEKKWTAQHYADALEKGLYQIAFQNRNENKTL